MTLFSDKKYTWEWLWATLILSFVFCIAFKKIINHPNQFLVSGGDGMKNYYTFMYHVKYDTTFWTFEGMNYPFGENIIFTDNQPLLVNITKIASKIFPAINCYLPSVHNLCLIIGFIFGALGLFLVFRQLKIDFFFAIIITIGLMLLHPQLTRINGHFALSYPILPWLFLFWIRIWDGGKVILLSVLTGIFILLSGMLHMYFFITGSILSCLAIMLWWMSGEISLNFKKLLLIFTIQIIIPFLILNFLSSYFNHAVDRPSSPWGFFSYHSYWEGLFFSYKLPLFEFINKNIIQIRNIDDEGKSYIGIASVTFLLYGIYLLATRFKLTSTSLGIHNNSGKLFWIFIISALISFGYPFTITGLEWMLDFTGPFKQFRSIGRVAWVSFYAINLYCIPIIYHWLKNRDWGLKRDILYFTLPCIILIEGLLFFRSKPINQTELDAYYCNNSLSKIPVNSNDYQALLPDPYFSAGSECFSWGDQGYNVSQSFELSYNLHLPTMGVNMSRTSFEQSFLLNEIICQPFQVPKIIRLLKERDPRPLLVVETKLEIHDRRASLTHWTKDAPIVYETDQYRLRKLELADFDSIVKHYNIARVLVKDSISASDISLSFHKTKGQRGWGYEAYLTLDSTVTGQYIFSYWLTCTDATRASAITELWQYDGNHQSLEYIGEANKFNYKRFDGQKVLIEIPLQIKSNTKKVVFRISKDRQYEKEDLEITKPVLKLNY